jgi:hypothetical protein
MMALSLTVLVSVCTGREQNTVQTESSWKALILLAKQPDLVLLGTWHPSAMLVLIRLCLGDQLCRETVVAVVAMSFQTI